MAHRKVLAVTFTAPKKVELTENEPLQEFPLDGVGGPTRVTLISPGTELNEGYLGYSQRYPRTMGYAAVFEVDQIGPEVTDIKPGDLAFVMGPHKSYQCAARKMVLAVPQGVPPEVAVFARIMGISMTTLVSTRARPGAEVLVSGLGPVGHFAAKIFAHCNYRVCAVDPIESRRQLVAEADIEQVWEHLPLEDETCQRRFALVVECSGHEQAVLQACQAARKGGEIVMIGVPWMRRTEIFAREVLNAVFFGNLTLRGGSEWTIPLHPLPLLEGSNFGNLQTALRWLASGEIEVGDLYDYADPSDAQQVYADLLAHRTNKLTTMFDWSKAA